MPSDTPDRAPGHVRRKLASGEVVAFVEVGERPPVPPAGQASPSEDLARIAGLAMLDLAARPAPIEALPFATGVAGGGFDAWALAEGDGIRIGVARSGTPADAATGVLLRHAPEPHAGLFALSGRGADGGMACNRYVASHVIGVALSRMCDEIRAVDGQYRLADVPGMYGSLFDQAFPAWVASESLSAEPEELLPGPSVP